LHDGSIQRGKNRAYARALLYLPAKNRRAPNGVASAEPRQQTFELPAPRPRATFVAPDEGNRPTPRAGAIEKTRFVGARSLAPQPKIPQEKLDSA